MRNKKARQQHYGAPAFIHMRGLIRRKRSARKDATADLYRATTNWLRKFWGNDSLLLTDITPRSVDRFHDFLLAQGHLRINSVNSYMNNFRAMYNQLVRDGLTPKHVANPFAHLSLRTEKTAKRSLTPETVLEIMRMDLGGKPDLGQARDLSLFSFLGCGIPFVDLAHLTRDNIIGDELIYNRVKTKTLIRVKITEGMRLLVDKYTAGATDSPYLFPIITPADEGRSAHEAYKRDLRKHNDCLKEIGRRLSRPFHYTSYVMRHTWATEALRKNTPVAVISQALGHTSEKTTRVYLAALDQATLNAANAIITKEIDCLVAKRA